MAPAHRALPVIVIYSDPIDFPGRYVTRRQWALRGSLQIEVEAEPLAVVDTIEEARAAVPPAQDHRLDRDPDDDPAIVECWI